MKSYSACLFDVDGTLLDTMDLIYRCFVRTCRLWGDREIDRPTVFSHVGIPLVDLLKLYLTERSAEEYRAIADSHMEYQSTIYADYLKIYPGVEAALAELARLGVRLGIVTSRTRPSLLHYLDHFDLTRYFEVIATPESTDRHKPDPQPLLWALNKLGCDPSDALFVGDALYDMECGRAAGVDTAFALWGPNDPSILAAEPEYLPAAVSDLIPLFSSGAAAPAEQ